MQKTQRYSPPAERIHALGKVSTPFAAAMGLSLIPAPNLHAYLSKLHETTETFPHQMLVSMSCCAVSEGIDRYM